MLKIYEQLSKKVGGLYEAIWDVGEDGLTWNTFCAKEIGRFKNYTKKYTKQDLVFSVKL